MNSIGFGSWMPAKHLQKYFKDILKTRRLTYGKYSKRLEELFCEKNGVKYAVFCSSGTAALYTALAVLKNQNPENTKKYVVLPATTFVADINIVTANGFEPLFVDINSSYNMSYADLESKLKTFGNQVFAVMPSSLMGRPIDGLKIKNIIKNFAPHAHFILDSCENICSKFDNQFPEEFAVFTAWSCYISHLLISGAAGGFIGTNDEKLAILARSFINHGREPSYISIDDDNNLSDEELRRVTGNRFKFVQHGLNFRLGEMEAIFALSMLEDDFEGQLEKRRLNAEFLIKELSKIDGLILPRWGPFEQMRHMMLPVRLNKGTKQELIHHLEKNGVETRDILPLYQPITEKYFGTIVDFQTNFPMSHEVYERGFYVGCHPYLTQTELNHIIETFKNFYK